MSTFFTGEYRHSLDSKGRLIVPSKFRDKLGSQFMIGRGYDDCLVIYSMEDWESFSARLAALPSNSEKARKLVRYFMSGTMEVEIDKQGRILLPAQMREIAGITKDVVYAGNGARAELWDADRYDAKMAEETRESIGDIAEELLGSGYSF